MYKQIQANKRKTNFLIIFFFIILIGIGYLVGYFTDTGYLPTIFALVIAILMTLTSYFAGDKVALASSGARYIEKKDNPKIYNLVENLCITAGLPMPKVHIITDPAPNAFATGRNPEKASIALTTGLIEKLENAELEAVIAHELSHIKNYDIRLMMIVIVLVGTIVLLSDMFLRFSFLSGRKSNSKSKGGNQILLLVGLALIIISPFLAKLIQLAVSRKREYLADADAALLTRYPEGLAQALAKISQYQQPMRKKSNATAHLFISSPFSGKKRFFSKFLSTHPPIKERILKLQKMGRNN